jgi:hypothetical protein
MKADPNSPYGQVLRHSENDSKPMISLPRAPQMEYRASAGRAGIYNGAVAPVVESFTSPGAIRTLPAAAAVGLARVAAPLMAKGAIDQSQKAASAASNPDSTIQQIIEPAAGAVSSAAMAMGAGRQALKPTQNPMSAEEKSSANGRTGPKQPRSDAERSRNSWNRARCSTGARSARRTEFQRSWSVITTTEDQGIGDQPPIQRVDGEIRQGNQEMSDPVRELPQEAPRGEAPAAAEMLHAQLRRLEKASYSEITRFPLILLARKTQREPRQRPLKS